MGYNPLLCLYLGCCLCPALAPGMPSWWLTEAVKLLCVLDQTRYLLQEVRRVWLGYMSQCDASLGQRIAAKVQAAGSM